MKYTHALLPLLLICFHSLAQYKSFEVKGESCVYNSKELIIEKVLFRDSTYASVCRISNIRPEMPINVLSLTDCAFSFNGEIEIPTPFSAVCPEDEPAKESDIFFIEAGKNQLMFGNLADSSRVVLSNEANVELEEIARLLGSRSFRLLAPEQVRKNLLFLNHYIKAHPDSYVAMWLMIIMVEQSKTKEKYADESVLQTCDLFSDKLQQNNVLLYFRNKFKNYKNINRADAVFPFDKLILGKKIQHVVEENEFVLVEFWSTGCKPCIQQLPELKQIFQEYNSKGFSIFSISTDPTEARKEKARIIYKNNGITWSNYFDSQELDYNALVVPYLPSNFLVDKTGKIIQKNINLDALSTFLEQKLRR